MSVVVRTKEKSGTRNLGIPALSRGETLLLVEGVVSGPYESSSIPLRKAVSALPILVIFLLCLFFSGCGHSTPDSVVLSGSTTGTTSGTLRLARLSQPETVGVRVAGLTVDGREVVSSQTDTAGNFRLTGLPPDGRVVAELAGGYRLSVDYRDGPPTWLWISGATTLVSRYQQAHPELSLADSEAAVKRHFGIPADIDLGSGLGDTWRSPFSWTAFVEAAGATPIESFIDEQVTGVGGNPVSFRRAHPYPALSAALGRHQNPITSVRGQGTASSFLSTLVDNTAADLVTDGVTAGFGWICEAAGLGSQGETSEIQDILDDLTKLSEQIALDQYSDDYKDAVTALAAPVSNIQSHTRYFINNSTTNPSGTAADLNLYVTGTPNLVADMSQIRDSLLGSSVQKPMIFEFSSWIQGSYGITAPSAGNLFLDIRSNAILDEVQTQLDYYQGHQLLGLNLAVEWAHLDPSTFSEVFTSGGNTMPGRVTDVLADIDITTRDLKTEQMMVPPATIASDNVIVDLRSGTMYYLQVFPVEEAKDIPQSAVDFALSPWGNCWYPATVEQSRTLRDLALEIDGDDYISGLKSLGFEGLPDSGLETYCGFPGGYYDTLKWNTNEEIQRGDGLANYQYILVRDCPGILSFYDTPAGPQPEDAGTLAATSRPASITTGQSASGVSATATYNYFAVNQLVGWVAEVQHAVDFTDLVTWTSSDNNQVTVSNVPSSNGKTIFHTASPFGEITATFLTAATESGTALTNALTSTTNFSNLPGTPTDPVVTSIMVVPLNQNFDGVGAVGSTQVVECYATGFRNDFTVVDLTEDVSWSVSSTSGLAYFDGVRANQLNLPLAMGDDGQVVLNVSYEDPSSGRTVTGTATITTSFP